MGVCFGQQPASRRLVIRAPTDFWTDFDQNMLLPIFDHPRSLLNISRPVCLFAPIISVAAAAAAAYYYLGFNYKAGENNK